LVNYKKATPVDQLAMMRQWTRDFQSEYRSLRDQANKP
jgi:hypothetical protein